MFVVERILDWYRTAARDLPWRHDEASPYAILVSEIMLQQTPVARVVGPWHAWMKRWPTPAALAASSPADVITAWGRLGYPRRALRLRDAAIAIVENFAGQVPANYDELRSLPGVGDYTAAAVASFGFGQREVVLDTNVRRVLARIVAGEQYPSPSITRAERELAASFVPDDERAPLWAAASMELGALICTARTPRCGECPVLDDCAWVAAGMPQGQAPKGQSYEGTDRQCRGRILALLREGAAVPIMSLSGLGVPGQVERCAAGLVADGLAELHDDLLQLPVVTR